MHGENSRGQRNSSIEFTVEMVGLGDIRKFPYLDGANG